MIKNLVIVVALLIGMIIGGSLQTSVSAQPSGAVLATKHIPEYPTPNTKGYVIVCTRVPVTPWPPIQ